MPHNAKLILIDWVLLGFLVRSLSHALGYNRAPKIYYTLYTRTSEAVMTDHISLLRKHSFGQSNTLLKVTVFRDSGFEFSKPDSKVGSCPCVLKRHSGKWFFSGCQSVSLA